MNFTVLGASGFIGSKLAERLRAAGSQVYAPGRGDEDVFRRPLGAVLYCVGLTADFRTRPFDTVRAHVSCVAELLERAQFESLLYLSSARVYGRGASGEEGAEITAKPDDPDDLYNLTKLAGESLCLHCGRAGIRVARLSNVYGGDFGSQNFLPALIREALAGKIVLRTAPGSAKDYVALDDVVEVLPRIATGGRERLYNVASGANVTNAEIAAALAEHTGCALETAAGAATVRYPILSITKVRDEFGFHPRPLLPQIGQLVAAYRRYAGAKADD